MDGHLLHPMHVEAPPVVPPPIVGRMQPAVTAHEDPVLPKTAVLVACLVIAAATLVSGFWFAKGDILARSLSQRHLAAAIDSLAPEVGFVAADDAAVAMTSQRHAEHSGTSRLDLDDILGLLVRVTLSASSPDQQPVHHSGLAVADKRSVAEETDSAVKPELNLAGDEFNLHSAVDVPSVAALPAALPAAETSTATFPEPSSAPIPKGYVPLPTTSTLTSLAAKSPAADAPLALPATLDSQASVMHPKCAEKMDSLNTALNWAESPGEAYRMATEQEKLVFMIHVSGNFEIPGFT